MNEFRKDLRELRRGMSGLFKVPLENAFLPVFEWDTEDRLFFGECSEAWEDGGSMSISFDLPGFEKGDISVSFGEGKVVLSAKRTPAKDRKYLVQKDLSVYREAPLPSGLDAEKAKAEYKNGVLTLTFPKVEGTRPRTIKVD